MVFLSCAERGSFSYNETNTLVIYSFYFLPKPKSYMPDADLTSLQGWTFPRKMVIVLLIISINVHYNKKCRAIFVEVQFSLRTPGIKIKWKLNFLYSVIGLTLYVIFWRQTSLDQGNVKHVQHCKTKEKVIKLSMQSS